MAQQISVRSHQLNPIERRAFEAVERKGIGHPDSLADLIAETFSNLYSRYCLREFGSIANHWVDKINLVGSIASVDYGTFAVHKPIGAYLFGKVTEKVGDQTIDVASLFQQAVGDVLERCLRRGDVLRHVRFFIDNNNGVGIDHDRRYYSPASSDDLARILRQEQVANDSVVCNAYAGLSRAERLAITLEGSISAGTLDESFPAIGTDVKVLVARLEQQFDVTVCLPFHPELTPNRQYYLEEIERAEQAILNEARRFLDQESVGGDCRARILANTKDAGKGAFLAPFGTALGKGDCGVVGRGNKLNGVISSTRASNVEAVAGKNPVHHAGKLYNVAAHRIAHRIDVELALENQVTIVARNGGSLSDPAFVAVDLVGSGSRGTTGEIKTIIQAELERIYEYTNDLVHSDPIARFREPFRMDLLTRGDYAISASQSLSLDWRG